MTPARCTPTVTLDGEHITCRTAEGAESRLPLRVDVLALEALEAASALAREVWHPGVRLASPRIGRGGALAYDAVQDCPRCAIHIAPAGCLCAECLRPPTRAELRWAARVMAEVAT